ncbi:hypothetical protein SteCoe_32965 [Stentor coeruleus]|uniref:C2H2-type domain-containing protein n=1 Tax=Stentor coeruleus TaxID=5963 RepID=A0A1R2AXU4_9CILI|nr:hypothetical protein SteCoe_32965 [Stentor coeruleus]
MIIFVLASLCSWDSSLEIRSFLNTTLPTILKTHNLLKEQLPDTCPFKISLKEDRLIDYYNLVKKETQSSYSCEKCGKLFRSENAIHEHIVTKHANNEGICLADFCDFFPCAESNEVVSNRCRAIMSLCFEDALLGKVVEYCDFIETSIWDLDLEKPGYMILVILSIVICFIYYLLLWAEMEERSLTPKKIKRKTF